MSSTGGPAKREFTAPLDFEQDLRNLKDARRLILAEPLGTAESRAQVRAYLLEAVKSRSDLAYAYRFFATDFPLESDLLDRLGAFERVEGSEDLYQTAVPDLKLIRRQAFQRYAFGLARETNRRLHTLGESRIWLSKDLLLPRIGLAIPVGYGVVLGKPAEWFWVLGRDAVSCLLLTIFFALSAWFLIYCNVREAVGNSKEAVSRSIWAFLVGSVWCVGSLLIGWGFTKAVPSLASGFEWGSGILAAVSSYAVAVLVQFFFSRSGSIADPL
mgnify:CR=1 FL=1